MLRRPSSSENEGEDPMVKVVAHRGYSARYPENTECAFRAALDLAVDAVELDVHLTSDQQLAVIHDPTVDRTTDGTGRMSQLTMAQIKRLDAGIRLDAQFSGQRVPTLQEALDLLAGKARLNIHLKAYDDTRHTLVELAAQEVISRDLLNSSFFASDEQTIALIKQKYPALAVCNLSTTPFDTYLQRSLALGCYILQPGNRQVTPDFVAEAHRNGCEVNPFYADDVDEMVRLIKCGVDGILTNDPTTLLRVRKDYA
jgi:glycerophosphoryl diester phosphodiesterase